MAEGTLDEMMRDYAEAAVELARDFQITLDYSERSLQGLEQILAQLSQEHRALAQQAPAGSRRETGQAPSVQKDSGSVGEQETGQAPSVQENDSQGNDPVAVEEQMVMMCKLWGGYFGEVVRRRWGGEWGMETYPGAQFATLTLNVRGAKLFPSMKIYRRLTEGEGEDVWSFYQRVREKLE